MLLVRAPGPLSVRCPGVPDHYLRCGPRVARPVPRCSSRARGEALRRLPEHLAPDRRTGGGAVRCTPASPAPPGPPPPPRLMSGADLRLLWGREHHARPRRLDDDEPQGSALSRPSAAIRLLRSVAAWPRPALSAAVLRPRAASAPWSSPLMTAGLSAARCPAGCAAHRRPAYGATARTGAGGREHAPRRQSGIGACAVAADRHRPTACSLRLYRRWPTGRSRHSRRFGW